MRRAVARIQAMNPDLLIVCDYGQILSTDALKAGRLGGLNLHGSLLPRHRGAAPVQWSVLAGDDLAGVSIIHMTPKLDGGPVLRQAATKIGTHENAFQLEARLSQLGVNALLDSIEQLRITVGNQEAPIVGVPQNPADVTKAPRLAKQDGQFDPRYPVAILDRLVRGLQPWPGVFGELEMDGNKRMRIAFQEVVPHSIQTDSRIGDLVASHAVGSLVWGKLLDGLNGLLLAIVCKDGLLDIASLQPAGKRAPDGQGVSGRLRPMPNDADVVARIAQYAARQADGMTWHRLLACVFPHAGRRKPGRVESIEKERGVAPHARFARAFKRERFARAAKRDFRRCRWQRYRWPKPRAVRPLPHFARPHESLPGSVESPESAGRYATANCSTRRALHVEAYRRST